MAKEVESKIILEREYIVPLRNEWLKVPEYKRANKAVKALKMFIARHMKIYDRDLRKIKIDIFLNNELRFRGIKKPPAKIKVRAIKLDNDVVRVELAELPEKLKFEKIRKEKKELAVKKTKKKEEKTEEKTEKKDEEKEESEEKKEKEESAKEENIKLAEKSAKEQKHISKEKKVVTHRKAMSR